MAVIPSLRIPFEERRICKGKGLHYFGVGISGGEDGARFGPSIMPGGNKAAYEEIRPILELSQHGQRMAHPAAPTLEKMVPDIM